MVGSELSRYFKPAHALSRIDVSLYEQLPGYCLNRRHLTDTFVGNPSTVLSPTPRKRAAN